MLERGMRRCCVLTLQLQTTDKCHINTHKVKFDLLLVHIYIEKGCVWCEGKSTPGLSPGKCNSKTLSPRGFFFISFHSINKRPILVWSNYSIKTAWKRSLIHLRLIAKVLLWEKNQHCQLQNRLRPNQSRTAFTLVTYSKEALWEKILRHNQLG